ncbi:MAG: class I SAM-dependent methyltransferase [Chloroflexota bacterium]|nr:class I SAM-dependent methyltransferase [Chloroflexota bacterium]
MNGTDGRSTAGPAPPKTKSYRWFAALYDAIGRFEEKGFRGEMRRSLLSGVSGDVLEIGAGTGANFEHYPSDARVTALEPDRFMAARAEKKLAALRLTNISLQRGPAESLPFPDASFDTIVSTLVLCTVSDVNRCLQEMRRVLRPSGKVLFIEHVRARGAIGVLQDVIRPVWGWFGAGCHPNRRTADSLSARNWVVVIDESRHMLRFVPLIRGHATPRA